MIPEELKDFIEKEAERAGYAVLELTAKSGRGFHIEVVLDKEGGITLDECGELNRRISSWIDEKGLLGEEYTVDVCSPGLDRELKNDQDLTWGTGRDVDVNFHQPVDGKSSVIGKLVGVGEDNTFTIELDSGDNITIDRKNVARVKLHVEI